MCTSRSCSFVCSLQQKGRLYLCKSIAICVTGRLIADQQRQQSQPLPDPVDLTQAFCSPMCLRLWHTAYRVMAISPARIQCHMCFSPPRPKWQPLTCKRKEEKTHMCWAEEQRGEEASEEGTGDGCLTGCGNTPFHSFVWQKNKHRATKLSLSPALMDKRWFFFFTKCAGPVETGDEDWPMGERLPNLTLLCSGFLVHWAEWVTPRLFWVLNHCIFLVLWLPQRGPMGGKKPLLQHLLCIFTYPHSNLGSHGIIPVHNKRSYF